MKKCYQYDDTGKFLFETSDYGQGLPRNATYIDPPEEKEGFDRVFYGKSWQYVEIPKEEEQEKVVLTQQDLLDRLNSWLIVENNRIASNLSLDLAAGITLKESQGYAQEDTDEVTRKYEEMLTIIQSGGNPFEEVQ